MSQVQISIEPALASRPLDAVEVQAFHQFGLTPGNWAALVAAPLYHRPGLRPPCLEDRTDCDRLEVLRRELRTVSGLSLQTVDFWRQLAQPSGQALTELAMRLLAWHLATDQSFTKRERFIRKLIATAEVMAPPESPRVPEELEDHLRLAIDCMLPCSAFPADPTFRWVHIPRPTNDILEEIAGGISAPAISWPEIPVSDAAQRLPALCRLMGEPISDWWGQPQVGRRAVEREFASQS
jgi:hypothetical protein